MQQLKEKARGDAAPPPRRARRIGRPPLEQAGEVEERILHAAIQVFLERGLEGASIELIAETARCGKPTIYARHANKEALFAAAIQHRILVRNARLFAHKPLGETVEERLVDIGEAVIRESVTEEFVGLMRLAVAEARRFPDLATDVHHMAKQRGVETIAYLLTQGVDGWTCEDGDTKILAAARLFAELILMPFLTRALLEGVVALQPDIPAIVKSRVTFFLAGLRNGGLD